MISEEDSCAAATILKGRQQEQSPTNGRGPMRGSESFAAADRQSFGGKHRNIGEPGQPHAT